MALVALVVLLFVWLLELLSCSRRVAGDAYACWCLELVQCMAWSCYFPVMVSGGHVRWLSSGAVAVLEP